jgi:putative transposase
MAGTYSQLYIQIVFAVKERANIIEKVWKDELYKDIWGTITKKNHKPIIINGLQTKEIISKLDSTS